MGLSPPERAQLFLELLRVHGICELGHICIKCHLHIALQPPQVCATLLSLSNKQDDGASPTFGPSGCVD